MPVHILRASAVLALILATAGCGEDGSFVDREMAIPDAQAPVSGDAIQSEMDAIVTQAVQQDPEPPPATIIPRIIVDQGAVVLTQGTDKVIPVSIDDGAGTIFPAQPEELTVTSANPGIVQVVSGPVPGQITIIPVAPGQTTVTISTPDDVKTIPVQVAPGVAVIRLGVNFEDIPTGGDFDYNDAVFCFSGKFAHSNQSVVSLEEQLVRINVTNRSGCDHWINIAVVDPDGTRRALPQFRSRTQPVLNLQFHPGSRLDVKMHAADQCLEGASWVGLGGTVTIPGATFGRPLVEVLNDVCRTTGS